MSTHWVKLAGTGILFLAACGVAAPEPTVQSPPGSAHAQFDARLDRCSFDPATGTLEAGVSFVPTVDAPSSVREAGPQLRVQSYNLTQVTDDSREPVTEELSVLARHRPQVSLRIHVGGRPPTSLVFELLELAVDSAVSLSAAAAEDLVGKIVGTPFGEARIEAVQDQGSELWIDMSLTPARVSEQLAVAGATGELLSVNGERIASTQSSLTPHGNDYTERLTFAASGPLAGPITLDIGGWSIRSLAPVVVAIPESCRV